MKVLRTVEDLRAVLAPAKRAGRTIGLVPTMGALHEGHLSLVALAREQCDVVVVSLFVNPAQFNEGSDLERYPRQEERDRELVEGTGADALFVPSAEEVYPAGFSTSVEVYGLTDRLEGAARGSSHFRGVTTVVTKLLNMVGPDVAYFGQKDAQQVIVVRRMVADLNIPVQIEVGATVRESDGLAMSSRNSRLDADERERALALHAALQAADEAVADGERRAETLLAVGRTAMERFEVEPEYLALVNPETLEPLTRLDVPALLAVAARLGTTRLIDNVVLNPTNPKRVGSSPISSKHSHSNHKHSTPATTRETQATCSV